MYYAQRRKLYVHSHESIRTPKAAPPTDQHYVNRLRSIWRPTGHLYTQQMRKPLVEVIPNSINIAVELIRLG